MKKLELLVHELNPKNDLIVYNIIAQSPEYLDRRDAIKNVLLNAYILIKPIIRGTIIGTGAGLAINYLTGKDMSADLETYHTIGAIIDTIQYYARLIYAIERNSKK